MKYLTFSFYLIKKVSSFFAFNSDMLIRFLLDCDHKRVSYSIPRNFSNNFIQQVGTYIQDPHSAPSIKCKRRSA